MRLALLSPLGFILLAAAPPSQTQFGLACSGTETVQTGAEPPRSLPYETALSIDLPAGRYCYAVCLPSQTFPIADPAAVPLVLADVHAAGQLRYLRFDAAAMALRDDQVIAMGALPSVTRHARATCKAAPFHVPPAG